MAFWGEEFIFNDIPSSEFGMELYHFGDEGQEDVDFQTGELIEDRILNRHSALTYGLVQNQSLEYTLIFGANQESLDANKCLDRDEVEAIAAWLTGHKERKWLIISQSDTDFYRYKCNISELKLITYGDYPWAFSCRVTCDSPFAYTFPCEYSYSVSGEQNIRLFNRSSCNGYYMPKMEIALRGGNIKIQNLSDNNRTFEFKDVPGGSLTIYIDNQNQIITNSADLNIYDSFNNKFLRLVRGDNLLKITGDADIKFICEFPVSIGG